MEMPKYFFILPDTVNVFAYKADSYKPCFIKNGICSEIEPKDFNLETDKLYIIAGSSTYSKEDFIKEYPTAMHPFNENPRDPYLPINIVLSFWELSTTILTQNLSEQIQHVLRWCSVYGMPFLGDDCLNPGNVQACFKDTHHIGFNFYTFAQNLMLLSNSTKEHTDAIKVLGVASLHKRELFSLCDHSLITNIYFNNLFSFICYLRCDIIYNSTLHIATQNLRRCKQCGKVFTCSNPRREFCDFHSPQSYYAMKKRKKEKLNLKGSS